MLDEPLSGSARRLAEELEEDGITLDEHPVLRDVVLDELDYARRSPMFEGRRMTYGSFSMPPGADLAGVAGLADVVTLEGLPRHEARTFADGRAAFLVNHHDAPSELACFDRPIQFEADVVEIQQATGARIVQRTPVLAQVRLFTEGCVVAWNGAAWAQRRTAATLVEAPHTQCPDLEPAVVHGLLDLAVHWLSPGRVGATLVVHEEQGYDLSSLDVATKFHAPALSITNRRHFPALVASLQQHDLATLVTADGSVEYLGVGLRSSPAAEQTVDDSRGMRHRSAQRFSYDHPMATVAVISENGPVTIFRGGQPINLSADS